MGKRTVLIFVFACISIMSSLAQDVVFEGENDGIIMLSVKEYNIKKKEAKEMAIQDAYFNLLFRGIPGSLRNRNALLGTDESIVNAYRDYYEDLINGDRLYTFVTYSDLYYYKKKVASVKLNIDVETMSADFNNYYHRFGLY